MGNLNSIDPDFDYPDITEEIYNYVIIRDSGLCQVCGKEGEEIHHILYKSQSGTNAPNNLVLLCWKHHHQYTHGESDVSNKSIVKMLRKRVKSNERKMRKRMT